MLLKVLMVIKMFYTQLTSDDIKDMIAGPSREHTLEQRLTNDFKCDYNFKNLQKDTLISILNIYFNR